MDEVKPDLERMRAQKKLVYDDIERLRANGLWFKRRNIKTSRRTFGRSE